VDARIPDLIPSPQIDATGREPPTQCTHASFRFIVSDGTRSRSVEISRSSPLRRGRARVYGEHDAAEQSSVAIVERQQQQDDRQVDLTDASRMESIAVYRILS